MTVVAAPELIVKVPALLAKVPVTTKVTPLTRLMLSFWVSVTPVLMVGAVPVPKARVPVFDAGTDLFPAIVMVLVPAELVIAPDPLATRSPPVPLNVIEKPLRLRLPVLTMLSGVVVLVKTKLALVVTCPVVLIASSRNVAVLAVELMAAVVPTKVIRLASLK